MAPSEDVQSPAAGPPSVPTLINDYRGRREALRAQARDLAHMREEVLVAADHESRGIVAAARGEVRQILVKARRDLLVLAAQVQAALDTAQETEPANAGGAGRAVQAQDDLRVAREVFASTRRDARRVLDEARPDLKALDEEAASLRSTLLGRLAPVPTGAPLALAEAPVATPPDLLAAAAAEPPVVLPRDPIAGPRSIRAFVVAFVIVGMSALVATGWWMRRSTSGNGELPQQVVEPVAAEPLASPPPVVNATGAPPQDASIEESPSLSVNVEARRLAWIRAIVDGRVTSARLFEAGETQQFTGSRDVSIRAGDAGAVFVSVNGGEATPLGSDGRAVTRRFALEELVESAGSSPPLLAGSISVVPSEAVTREESAQSPVPGSGGPGAPPQASTLSVNAPGATLSADVVPPVVAAEPPARAATPTTQLTRQEISTAAERWLAAYFRQDQNAMAVFSDERLSISDERTQSERLQGIGGFPRLADVDVQIFGENAIFTAKIAAGREDTEAARTAASDSFVSQIWTRRVDAWRLTDVRIVSRATLSRSIRWPRGSNLIE